MTQPSDTPSVVIMCGISGSGKTHYAKALAADGYTRISADQLVWEEYGDSFVTLPQDCRMQAFKDVQQRVANAVERAIAKGEKVVVDATMCKRARRDDLVGLCRRLGVEPLIVYLKAPYELLSERLANRHGCGPDDQIVTDAQLRRYCGNFEPPAPDEPHRIIPQLQ